MTNSTEWRRAALWLNKEDEMEASAQCSYQNGDDIRHAAPILATCLARLWYWRTPPNWSHWQWFEEIAQVARIAAWQADQDFDASRGTSYRLFVHDRIIQRALAHYRKERLYAYRFIAEADQSLEDDDAGATPLAQAVAPTQNGGPEGEQYERLLDALAALEEDKR